MFSIRNQVRIFVAALVQSLVICQQTATCPSGNEAVRQLQACLRGYESVTDFTTGSANVTAIRTYCSVSAQSEIACANEIVEACKRTSPTARRVLENALNVDGIENGVRTVCNNAELLVEKQTCLGNLVDRVAQCVAARYNEYRDRLEVLQFYGIFLGARWLERQVYIALCNFTNQVADCQDLFGQVCGQDIGFVFDAISEGSRPPICEPRQGTFQTTTTAAPAIPVRRRRAVDMTDSEALTAMGMSHAFVFVHRRSL